MFTFFRSTRLERPPRAFALRLCPVVLLLLIGTSHLSAQKRAMNWYFGINAGVTFVNGTPEALSDGQVVTTEGCATISSQTTGELLFYTDGITVWNRLHEPMPNGNGLLGDESTSQSALIIPLPNNSSRYLIVTPAPITSSSNNGRCFCLTYSVVEMKAEDGFGDVVAKNVILEDDITEHLTAAPDCEGGGWWIIARKRIVPSFVAFHLTTEGISTIPVVSNIKNGFEVRDAGQLQSSPNGMHLVLTSASGLSLLYDFERTTGTVYNGLDLFSGIRVGTHYGATFTNDNRYVYSAVTTNSPNIGTSIYRWNIQAGSRTDIVLSREQVAWLPETNVWTPMQLGPDGMIYVGRPGESLLARFTSPSAIDPGYRDSAVVLTGECRSGLPNFPGALMLPNRPGDAICRVPIAILLDTSLCMNECVRMTDESIGKITLRSWLSSGSVPTTSSDQSPRFCFSKAGVWPVRLIVTNEYGDDTTTAYVTVYERPDLHISKDISICKGGSTQLFVSGSSSVRWFPASGLSDPSIPDPIASPDVTTRYMVVGTSTYGCKDTAFVQINVASPSAGSNETVCSGESVVLIATGAKSYLWSPAASLNDPTSATPTATPDSTTSYIVRMKVDSCIIFDTVVVTVVASVDISLSAPTTVCRGKHITLRASGNANSYSWIGNGIILSDADSAVFVADRSGRYTVVGRIGKCNNSDSVSITVLPSPTLTLPSDVVICEGASTTLTVTSDAASVEWSPTLGLNTNVGTTVQASPQSTTIYTVSASNNVGCTTTGTITVTVTAASLIDAGTNKEICKGESVRLSATGSADRYRWEPTVGLSSPDVLSPVAQPVATTVYRLTATKGGCVYTDSMVVIVSEIDVALSRDTSICFGSSTELLAIGATSYRWDPIEGLSDPTIANPIASPRVTTTYEVTGIDAIGCVDKDRITVTVIDTSSIRIEAGTVTADAGLLNFGIPVYADVDPQLLPLRVPKLTATLVSDASVFIPTSVDRGSFVTGIRDNTRRTYFTLNDVLILSSHQKLTEIRSTILLGRESVGSLDWEDVVWTGVICPTPVTVPGILYVTGCSLQTRVLKLFVATTIDVDVQTSSDLIDLTVHGGEPGTFTVRLVSIDGRVLEEQSSTRAFDTEEDIQWTIRMSDYSSGLYTVVIDSPTDRHITRIAWMP